MTNLQNPPHLLLLFSSLVSPAIGLVGKCLFVLLSLNEIIIERDFTFMFINITLMLCTPAYQDLMYPIFALHYDKLVNEVYGPDLPREKFQNRSVCSQAVRIRHS